MRSIALVIIVMVNVCFACREASAQMQAIVCSPFVNVLFPNYGKVIVCSNFVYVPCPTVTQTECENNWKSCTTANDCSSEKSVKGLSGDSDGTTEINPGESGYDTLTFDGVYTVCSQQRKCSACGLRLYGGLYNNYCKYPVGAAWESLYVTANFTLSHPCQ